MNLKQKDLWCVEIGLPGTLKCLSRAVNWLCHFDTQPTKEIILAALEDLADYYEEQPGGGFYTRMFESVTFWDGVKNKNAQIMVAGTSIGQINVTKVSPYFVVGLPEAVSNA